MKLRHMLGWIGRSKRQECAHDLSERLTAKIGEMDSGNDCVVILTNRSQLGAFRARPLSPSLSQQINKLERRIRRDVGMKYGSSLCIRVEVNATRYRIRELKVRASFAAVSNS